MAATQKKHAPYGLGFNGHARVCDCVRCANVRALHVAELAERSHRVKAPTSADATVFVRPHFRRQSGHLRKFARTRMAVTAVLKRCM